jgi:ribosomal protein S3
MGRKINPISLRLGTATQQWDSNWHTSNQSAYGKLLAEDFEIRRYLESVLTAEGILINKIYIRRNFRHLNFILEIYTEPKKKIDKTALIKYFTRIKRTLRLYSKLPIRLNIKNLQTARIIVRQRNQLKQKLNKKFFQFRKNPLFLPTLDVLLLTLINPKTAGLLGNYIAQELQKTRRHVFLLTFIKRLLNTILSNVTTDVSGIRINVKGRLNGADRSRKQSIQYGSIPLQTISSTIDYSFTEAFTIYGTFGIKVWISYKK